MDKYLNYMSEKILGFIGSMEFMTSSLENLVKNMPKGKFKYLSQGFSKIQLELVKQKGHHPYLNMNSF